MLTILVSKGAILDIYLHYPKTANIKVSVGQEVRRDGSGHLWLRVSLKVAVDKGARAALIKGLAGAGGCGSQTVRTV